MKRLFTLTAVILVVATGAFAQGQGTLTGKVIDPEGLALPGVSVSAESEAMMPRTSSSLRSQTNPRSPISSEERWRSRFWDADLTIWMFLAPLPSSVWASSSQLSFFQRDTISRRYFAQWNECCMPYIEY